MSSAQMTEPAELTQPAGGATEEPDFLLELVEPGETDDPFLVEAAVVQCCCYCCCSCGQ